LVDSNVLLDVLTNDRTWAEWSISQMERLADMGRLVINPVIYAEIATGFDSKEALETALHEFAFVRAQLPWDAAFLASRAFNSYKSRGGVRRSPLPDFFIGAHAAVWALTLLTRDAARYRTYFPTLTIVAPDTTA
jgi:predicted nucleic acid-binding protein